VPPARSSRQLARSAARSSLRSVRDRLRRGAARSRVAARHRRARRAGRRGGRPPHAQRFNMREEVAFRTLYQEGGTRQHKDTGISILQGRTVGGTTVVNWTPASAPPTGARFLEEPLRVAGFASGDLAPALRRREERLSIAEIPLDLSNRNNRLLYDGCRRSASTPRPTRRNVKSCDALRLLRMGCPVDAKQSHAAHLPARRRAHGATVLTAAASIAWSWRPAAWSRARRRARDDGTHRRGPEVVIEARRLHPLAGGSTRGDPDALRPGRRRIAARPPHLPPPKVASRQPQRFR